ncbi:hypothetical protein CRM22_002483 [Opisthorchis felineus]|uniref:Peptidase M16 N-terminal domain-containing protein n=2 Tax=Opisthorchis felineus TaxID=147828 RepID=A0A4S2MAE8_OPIFE|nr:hypothetical protein CRM22_002483 [Opisthorchis felineus]
MFRHAKLCQAGYHVRNAVTSAAAKPSTVPSPLLSVSEEGFQLACISQPSLWPCYSRVAIVFNAGSRYEREGKDRGITHLIRRSCGLSTFDHSAVNMTRHLQQMGARVTCTTTREHMIYTVDVAPNLVSRAGSILAELATGSAFYHWELKSIANKLMNKDIDLLNRRYLPALAMELLHEAAFGLNPLGSGLGYSVFAPADRVGSYTIDQIEKFHQYFFTPANTTIALVGHDSDQDGLELLRRIKGGLKVRAPKTVPEKVGKVHGFVGGDVRRDLAAASSVTANLAWPTPGSAVPDETAFDLAASLLSGAIGRVAYSHGETQTHLTPGNVDDGVEAVAFHKAYTGEGLFGVSVSGPTAQAVEERLSNIVNAIRAVKFTAEELARAKALRKADILMSFESPMTLATDLAVQVSKPGHTYQSPEDRAAVVDKVTLEQLNGVFNQMAKSSKAALSVVGPEAGEVLPLTVLLS